MFLLIPRLTFDHLPSRNVQQNSIYYQFIKLYWPDGLL